MWKRFEEERCYLCRADKYVLYKTLKYSEERKWRDTFLSIKCLTINEEVVYKRINCIDVVELRNTLYKVSLKWRIKSVIYKYKWKRNSRIIVRRISVVH
jgi:hypothetical protein